MKKKTAKKPKFENKDPTHQAGQLLAICLQVFAELGVEDVNFVYEDDPNNERRNLYNEIKSWFLKYGPTRDGSK